MEQGTAEQEPHARAWVPAQAGPAVPRRHSVRGQVLAALRHALVGGELTPGEVYSAPALAERYGVSATPVREAMQQLAGEGAVEVVPNRGFRVAERSSVTSPSWPRSGRCWRCPRSSGWPGRCPERWEALRPLAEAGVTAAAHGDRVGYAEADCAFHDALMALTGNRRLTEVTGDLLRRAQWPPADGPRRRTAELLADASEHTALLDALVAQEYAVAERIAREHVSVARHPH